MSWAWALALRSMLAMARSSQARSAAWVRSLEAHPRMAVSGVRSSWDSVWMNSSLVRLARSASWRARLTRSNADVSAMAWPTYAAMARPKATTSASAALSASVPRRSAPTRSPFPIRA
jgi:hypothetical protein